MRRESHVHQRKTQPVKRRKSRLRFGLVLMPLLVAVVLLADGGRAALVSVPSAMVNASNASSTPQAGICSNPYYPVTAGTKRVYRNTTAAGAGMLTYTYSKFGVAGFTEHVETQGGTTQDRTWYCDEQGIVQDILASVKVGRTQLDFLRVSGVTIPGPNQWRVGAKWQTTYKGNGHIGSMEVGGSATATSTITASGLEAVEAGTFQAFKVETVVTQEMVISLNPALPSQSGQPTKYTITSWYSKDIGLIKAAGEGSTSELVSFTIR